MISYQYTAYDHHGAKIQGQVDANSDKEAKQQLKHKKLTVIELAPKQENASISVFNRRSSKVSLQALEFITSELAILLKSGVRLDKGLDILKNGAANVATTSLLDKLSSSIKGGKSISESFADFPEVFEPLYINMIKLGEASGNLDNVFERLAADLKFRRTLQSKIIQSLTYPSVILFVCVACILFVFNYIVPQMSAIFDRADELPVYTQMLLSTSDWFINYQLYLAVVLIAAVVIFIQSLKNEKFSRAIDEFGLKLPLLGNAILLVERIRFNSSMAMMLSSGVALVDALRLSATNVKNTEIRSLLKTARSKIKQGGTLSESLQTTPLFTEFNISLVEVGEESGELVPVFEEISERSRQDFESWTETLTSMIEPILILIMGGIVGSVVVVMLLSIVSTNEIGL